MTNKPEENHVYEHFDVGRDILFFKVGSKGIVCFHGENYHIKKRMTPEQINKLKSRADFLRLHSDCFVNVDKISSIENEKIRFGHRAGEWKQLPISKRKEQLLRNLLSKSSSG
ncbi:LytTR family transcriptional regulator DNA-binding domain-containing protein [Marinicrinis lubricantis]|uniref:LytTR family transcriptional regulator DNA-binding domain-containing protein n=1 Tax=Marinicrinis lubricantis TaxID=2086470 RepID=A0ABW1IP63_9BACL